jgi:hypothetical protein
MTEIVRTTIVPASADAVWALLSDFGGISSWAANVDHSCLMSEQVEGRGTVRRIQTGRTTLVERVELWEPTSRLSYSVEGMPPIVRSAANTWSIEPEGADVRVSLTSRIDCGSRPPQKLIARIVGRRIAQASGIMLAGLKERLS